MLAEHRIERLADVRRYPASRRCPHFNRETLATVLAARDVEYRWFEALGGRRPGRAPASSPNRGLTAPGFRGYADYMLEPEFRAALAELVDWMRERRTAILCAEALWWKCHRRLIADRLAADGVEVRHIRGARVEPHTLWDLAVRSEAGLVYPPVQGELGLPSGDER